MHLDTCDRKSCSVSGEEVQTNTAKHESTIGSVLIHLVDLCLRSIDQVQTISCPRLTRFHLVNHSTCSEIEFTLAKIEISTSIDTTTLVNTSAKVSIVS